MGSKTWATTAEFNTGTHTGLATAGNELTVNPVAVWAAGGLMSNPRKYAAAFGALGAAVAVGGTPTATDTLSEEYDGTAWSGGGALAMGRAYHSGFGALSAGVVCGGSEQASSLNTTEEYNGTSWAAGGNLAEAREGLASCGTLIAGLCFGGFKSPDYKNNTEEYNGTAWAAGGNIITWNGRYGLMGFGTLGAAVNVGGTETSVVTEEYDGAAWSSANPLNSGIQWGGAAGVLTDGLAWGGSSNITESYDGTTWSIEGNQILWSYQIAGAGMSNAALSIGGKVEGATAATYTEQRESPSSGTWTIDIDGSAIVTFSPIACNIGSTVQARIKTAVNQAGLGAAAWVPASGYYTAFPATVTATMNQWSRLEFSLSGVETVQDITLSWAKLAGGNPSGAFSLGINRKLSL
jgi:hypothetical protein